MSLIDTYEAAHQLFTLNAKRLCQEAPSKESIDSLTPEQLKIKLDNVIFQSWGLGAYNQICQDLVIQKLKNVQQKVAKKDAEIRIQEKTEAKAKRDAEEQAREFQAFATTVYVIFANLNIPEKEVLFNGTLDKLVAIYTREGYESFLGCLNIIRNISYVDQLMKTNAKPDYYLAVYYLLHILGSSNKGLLKGLHKHRPEIYKRFVLNELSLAHIRTLSLDDIKELSGYLTMIPGFERLASI